MPISDPLEILLMHDRWAMRNTLDACANLTPEQFHQRFEMGPGSLHDTLIHIITAMRVWADVLAVRAQRPRLERDRRSVTELVGLLDEVANELVTLAAAHPLAEMVSRERDGKTYTFTRGAVLTHVATHGMHHRAQCLNMLRHVGVSPLPMSSVTDWARTVDSKQ